MIQSDHIVTNGVTVLNDLQGWIWVVIPVLMAVVGPGGGHMERRFVDRRKAKEEAVDVSIAMDGAKLDRASGSVEGHREEARGHSKLLIWDQDGSCHEGKTPCIGKTTMFVESTWMAPIGSDVTVSLIPGEGDSVGQELIQGRVVWHCPQDDEFGNQEGFGVLFQRKWAQLPGPDIVSGPKEGV